MQRITALILMCTAALLQAQSGRMPVQDAGRQLADGNNKFALELYRKLPGRDNLFVSPYSISTALAMTCLGARGRTAKEMQHALHIPAFLAPPARLAPAFGRIQKALQADPKRDGFELNVANALWAQNGYTFKKDFLNLNNDHLGGSTRLLDFRQTEAARRTINGWVEKQTRDKIKDLLPRGAVNADTRLVLTNAIYFKGKWGTEFLKKNTRTETFYGGIDGKTKIKTPLMYQSGTFRHISSEQLPQRKTLPGFDIVMLPYKGAGLSMIVILPKQRDGLPAVERRFADLPAWIRRLGRRDVQLHLPRFKIAGQTISLTKQLTAMGMKAAFQAGNADFSGIDGTRNLVISDVFHKAFVEVNEEGTEAAAATGVVVGITSVQEPQPPVKFRADHPFMFLIRENRYGSILFMGRVVKP